jgi:hypothetical protein
MKYLKADGTIEDGTPLTDEQLTEISLVKELVHEHICRQATHYYWQPKAKCVLIAHRLASGDDFRTAIFAVLSPEPELIPEPVSNPEDQHPLPHPTGVEV